MDRRKDTQSAKNELKTRRLLRICQIPVGIMLFACFMYFGWRMDHFDFSTLNSQTSFMNRIYQARQPVLWLCLSIATLLIFGVWANLRAKRGHRSGVNQKERGFTGLEAINSYTTAVFCALWLYERLIQYLSPEYSGIILVTAGISLLCCQFSVYGIFSKERVRIPFQKHTGGDNRRQTPHTIPAFWWTGLLCLAGAGLLCVIYAVLRHLVPDSAGLFTALLGVPVVLCCGGVYAYWITEHAYQTEQQFAEALAQTAKREDPLGEA